ncbi:MAG TPA: RNA-protein complex protein Nop10 [Thermofilum sp.]|nr:RNA-protein complex protein Nop10 [Thermoproteales archaeon]HDJ97458.1 RNA-protein complex protein Nop10 [Thermofilum sp.]
MGRRGLLRKCVKCGRYTLREDKCPYCGGEVRSPHPAKFSPEDPHGKYRRKMKLIALKDDP